MSNQSLPIRRYTLSGAWSGAEIFGTDLADALLRTRRIQRPDRVIDRKLIAGETVDIIAAQQIAGEGIVRLNGDPAQAALVQGADYQYFEVKAIESAPIAYTMINPELPAAGADNRAALRSVARTVTPSECPDYEREEDQ